MNQSLIQSLGNSTKCPHPLGSESGQHIKKERRQKCVLEMTAWTHNYESISAQVKLHHLWWYLGGSRGRKMLMHILQVHQPGSKKAWIHLRPATHRKYLVNFKMQHVWQRSPGTADTFTILCLSRKHWITFTHCAAWRRFTTLINMSL